MSVTPLPLHGGVHLDQRDEGRALRVSAHPELGSVVLSIWRGDRCVATHRLDTADVPELIRLLATSLIATSEARATAS
jgi:hypothetical protein